MMTTRLWHFCTNGGNMQHLLMLLDTFFPSLLTSSTSKIDFTYSSLLGSQKENIYILDFYMWFVFSAVNKNKWDNFGIGCNASTLGFSSLKELPAKGEIGLQIKSIREASKSFIICIVYHVRHFMNRRLIGLVPQFKNPPLKLSYLSE